MHALTAISLGFDSFLACTVLGMISLSWRERLWLAAAFGLWDGWASLLGASAPAVHWLPLLIAAAILSAGIAPRRRWLYALPVLFSLDNLFAATPSTMAPILGLSSAVWALIGLCAGDACRRKFTTFSEARQFNRLSGVLR